MKPVFRPASLHQFVPNQALAVIGVALNFALALAVGSVALGLNQAALGDDVQPALATGRIVAQPPLDYLSVIAPLLTRSGCNAIRCHGAADGQGDLNLSLRGSDPRQDHAQVLSFCDPDAPIDSPVLRKPTEAESHGGGLRWLPDADEVALVNRWIEAGMPYGDATPPQRLAAPRSIVIEVGQNGTYQVQAVSEGVHDRVWDVTELAEMVIGDPKIAQVLDPGRNGPPGIIVGLKPGISGVSWTYRNRTVLGQIVIHPPDTEKRSAEDAGDVVSGEVSLMGDGWVRTSVDRQMVNLFEKLRRAPAPRAPAPVLLRRLYFDLIGRPPSDDEQALGKAIESNEHFDQLVDRLINDSRFADKWGRIVAQWNGLDETRLGVAGYAMRVDREKLAYQWLQWVRDRIDRDEPLNQIAAAHLVSSSRNGRSLAAYTQFHDSLCNELRQGRWETEFAAEPTNDLFWKSMQTSGVIPSESILRQYMAVDLSCARCHDDPYQGYSRREYQTISSALGNVVYFEQTLTANEKRTSLSLVVSVCFAIVVGGLFCVWRFRIKGMQLPRAVAYLISLTAAFALFVFANYLHWLAPGMAPSRLGIGHILYQVATDATVAIDSVSIPSGELLLVFVVGIVLCAMLVVAWRSRSAEWKHYVAVGMTIFLALIFSDVIHVLPSAGNHSSSWLHACHRSVLAQLGMTGQNAQPREIYLSPAFHSNSAANSSSNDVSLVQSETTCPAVVDGNSPGPLAAVVDSVARESSVLPWAGWLGESDPRQSLADWCFIEDPENRFATKVVNQVWREVFGVAIAPNPDDIGARFPPIAPDLLDGLARDFRYHNYSLRWLLRELLCSATYRQQPRGSDDGSGDATITDFTPRPLRGEERFELVRLIAGNDFDFGDHVAPGEGSAYSAFVELRPQRPADHLLLSMRRGAIDSPGDLPTAAVHDSLFNENLLTWLRLPGGSLQEIVNSDTPAEDNFIELYQRVTGQRPTAEQVEYAAIHVRSSADAKTAWTEILWVLLNSETSFFNY